MKQVTIYTLSDPDTGEVRYVGKANNMLRRLKTHLRDSATRNTPLYAWVRKLTAKNKLPRMDVLRVVDASEWEEAEREAIACYRIAGGLLNLADGGAGPSCSKAVRAANGRENSRLREADPVKKHIWNIKRRLGAYYADNTLTPAQRTRLTTSMRNAARLHPQHFGAWAGLV